MRRNLYNALGEPCFADKGGHHDFVRLNPHRRGATAHQRAITNPLTTKETIMTATKTRSYTKHDTAKIAKRILKAGGTVKGPQVGDYAVLRAALREKIIKPTSKRNRTGKRGRPAIFYTLTLKGRNLAKRA